ncbi:DUF4013 domain-containing protein [Candidatus Korarchaeum cryptofilum]|jgi:hypothetical protein|uniref:DUF4013 domain-containing protein n=1 Tax=Candidatus Korarchaeum cryptofilum TaxID=498846 RepID=A0A3R9PE01_9CREN|nr:DUF4013 domain-containing protein [Candidatus Korarchaeum cryptofilum]RSN69210.1 DUF4013 domain-containing protein [Candidatus Korarchaeum cryptofilum]
MDLSDNLNRSASFVGKLFSDAGNLLILIVLGIIPIVNLIVTGYFARIVRENPEEPPKLSDYVKLFIDGLLVAIAAIIYMIVPIIILGVGIAFSIGGYAFYSPMSLLSSLLSSGLVIVGVILAFIFAIFGVIAIGNMIRTGNFSKIFAFSENWQLIQRIGLGNYILWLVVMFVIGLIAATIGSEIHWVVGSILGALLEVFYGKSLALMMNEAMGTS